MKRQYQKRMHPMAKQPGWTVSQYTYIAILFAKYNLYQYSPELIQGFLANCIMVLKFPLVALLLSQFCAHPETSPYNSL